jgi:hypothetical protein
MGESHTCIKVARLDQSEVQIRYIYLRPVPGSNREWCPCGTQSLDQLTKEAVVSPPLLTLLLFGGGIPRSWPPRISLLKSPSAALRF